jgi:ABC-type transport system involved in Fe-S cluster assembly, permease component
MGQFERTLIIAEPGSYVHYVEGCTAPTYSSDSLHSAVVELIAKPGARIRYTTVQNWSTNVYNLVTKRAVAYADAAVEWVDCNLGSKLTMKYPSIYLLGERAHGEVLSIAFAAPASTKTRAPRSSMPRQHDLEHLRQVDLKDGAAAPTAACSRSPRAPTAPVQGRLRRIAAGRALASDTYPTIRSARTTSTSATRRPSRRSGTSSST